MEKVDKFLLWPPHNFSEWSPIWPLAIGKKSCKILETASNDDDYYSINYMMDGELSLSLKGYDKAIVKKGMIFVIPPNFPYSYVREKSKEGGKTLLFWVRLTGPYAKKHIETMGFSEGKYIIEPAHPKIVRQLIEDIISVFYNYNNSSDADAIAILYRFIGAISNDYVKMKENVSLAVRIRDFMYREIGQGFNINQTAQIFNVSRYTIIQHFKKEFNMSPSKVLKNIRMEKAMNLLIKTDLSIRHIARQSGYATPNNFIHQFKNEFKKSPSEFRNSKREQK